MARWRGDYGGKGYIGPRCSQQVLPFVRRSRRRVRAFKAVIFVGDGRSTVGCDPRRELRTGRHGVLVASNRVRWGEGELVGLEPTASGDRGGAAGRAMDRRGADAGGAGERGRPGRGRGSSRLLKAARMDPETAVIRWGNFDGTLVLSSDVFEPDDAGRSYRFKPFARSVWFMGLSTPGGPAVSSRCSTLRRPPPRARRPGASRVPGSVQTTNSWGCRGPEPDTRAAFRGIVLGDSVMQGAAGRRRPDTSRVPRVASCARRPACGSPCSTQGSSATRPSSITIRFSAYFDRMSPHFVIVSLCTNDFGDPAAPTRWEESCYWLEQIGQFCRTRQIPYPDRPLAGRGYPARRAG